MKRTAFLLLLGVALISTLSFETTTPTIAESGNKKMVLPRGNQPFFSNLTRPATNYQVQRPALGKSVDPVASYLSQSQYPPDSRPLTDNSVDLIEWNRRYESPRTSGLDKSLSYLFSADKFVVSYDEKIQIFLDIRKGGKPHQVAEIAAELRLPNITIPIPLIWQNGLYTASIAPEQFLTDHVNAASVTAAVDFRHANGVEHDEIRFRVTGKNGVPARFLELVGTEVSLAGSLLATVKIDVIKSGHFILDANLWDSTNKPIASARTKKRLSQGEQTVVFRFFGKAIVDRQPIPPFSLRQVRGMLYQPGEIPDLADMPPIAEFQDSISVSAEELSNAVWDSPRKREKLKILRETNP